MKTEFARFEDWLEKVDAVVCSRLGLSYQDLPDCCYRDWFDEGVTPYQAAMKAVRRAKGGEE